MDSEAFRQVNLGEMPSHLHGHFSGGFLAVLVTEQAFYSLQLGYKPTDLWGNSSKMPQLFWPPLLASCGIGSQPLLLLKRQERKPGPPPLDGSCC